MNENIIADLELMRERIRTDAEREMGSLTDAIIILSKRNDSPAPTEEVEETESTAGPSVAERVLSYFASQKEKIVEACHVRAHLRESLAGEELDKANRGVSTALNSLDKRKKIHRVPGGYKFGPRPADLPANGA